MKISAQGIENMLVTFVIHDYGVEKTRTWKKDTFPFSSQQILN